MDMRKLVVFAGIIWMTFICCQDVTVGFLNIENASYEPDTVFLKSVLDTATIKERNPLWDSWIASGEYTEEDLIGYGISEYISKPGPDYARWENKAPWVSFTLQGYEGTEQIKFSVESVKSTAGEEAARIFMNELSIRGGGALIYPMEHHAVPGHYVISVRLTNPGYSKVLEDAITFVVE